ncbi:tripartite tricarboxylate transporter substrate binding protein [Bradyrhizobium sp. LTSP857]|uniref:Bug family tripartite tricarboxylate transporter substrate binding protein n=1 Tax=Bradyrhizobium sp. LTSP857 TaxID=1619231 RepID=UPI001FD933C7|nr:tripartite tricarboxylate transporter substrate binding protein [Bradyrhizobium sp. LTSP857]
MRIVVGFPPGGPTDILARLIGQSLSERLKQPVIVENRPGAGGNPGVETVVRAEPDGHTLLLIGVNNAINTTLYERLSFSFVGDIAPVASLIRVPMVLEVNPSVPVRTVPEFITYAKDNPGKLNMASAGIGSPQQVAGELFKMMTGVDLVHVPYRGTAPALIGLIAGQTQVIFDTTPVSIGYIQSGQIRPLAVTTTSRADLLPDLPTLNDFVPGYEASAWYGVGAPANTPAEIVDTLNREINAAITEPGLKAQLANMGGTALVGSPADFRRLIVDETEKWGKVVKISGARAE